MNKSMFQIQRFLVCSFYAWCVRIDRNQLEKVEVFRCASLARDHFVWNLFDVLLTMGP